MNRIDHVGPLVIFHGAGSYGLPWGPFRPFRLGYGPPSAGVLTCIVIRASGEQDGRIDACACEKIRMALVGSADVGTKPFTLSWSGVGAAEIAVESRASTKIYRCLASCSDCGDP
ncbi:hypothetical protein GCM10009864_02850 [Streptomyces lunalinharesii]|uniref:Uncharacterized protein n=1 Tax=Streptomyces lunalinharesii TaxID=333384 RepID=A0ABN3R8Y9_9ACTN